MSARQVAVVITTVLSAHVAHAQIVALDDNDDIGQVARVAMPDADIYHIKNVSYGDLKITAGDELPLMMFRKRTAEHSTHTLERAAIQVFKDKRAAQADTAEAKRTRYDYRAEWLADEPILVGFLIAFAGKVNRDSIRPIESTDGKRVTAAIDLVGGTPMTVIVDVPAEETDAFKEEQTSAIVGGMFFKRVSAEVAKELGASNLGEQTVVPYVVLSELKPIGVDVSEELLKGVQHRKPVGITKREEYAYYRLLLQAKLLDSKQLKQAAHETAKTRLENHRELTVKQYRKLLAQADELEMEGDEFADQAAAIRAGAEKYMQQQVKLNRAWTARPEKYSAFLDSIVDPDYFAGRPIMVSGRVREVRKFPVDSDIFGINTLYEIWLFPEDGQSNPTVVVCTEVPEGFPVEENVVENVNVTGYFFKLHAYEADDTTRITPMILAKTIQWLPYNETPWPVWAKPAIIAVTVLLLLGLVFAVRRGSKGDREFQSRIKETVDGESEPDFSAMSNIEPPTIGPPDEERNGP